MSHLTAGDISPLYTKSETTYGTPDAGDPVYYADIKGDGGNFTPTDNPNPYIAWRSDSRAFAIGDYAHQNFEAGYTDVLEKRDIDGWWSIIDNAMGSNNTTGTQRLPSRTTTLRVKAGNAYDKLEYRGCKTDRLEIRADQPGGVVEFSETVLASRSTYSPAQVYTPPALPPKAAVQWVGGVTVNNTTIYPQNFRISINNNLGRVKGWIEEVLRPGTVGLTEGQLDMELSFDLWMEDLAYIGKNTTNSILEYYTFKMTLGLENPIELTLYGSPMYDGQLPALIQDKQMETVRYRIENISHNIPE